jgi:hypothetical protein
VVADDDRVFAVSAGDFRKSPIRNMDTLGELDEMATDHLIPPR